MISFLYDLKGQATVLNGLLLLLIIAFLFYRYHRRKTAKILGIIAVLIFYTCSTAYLPNYMADKIERKYSPIRIPYHFSDSGKVLIHILGSGYTLDKRLPPNGQIGLVALGRLAEGIRIHRLINNSKIICSGYSSIGLETQAQVTKRAAIALGMDSERVETLNKPSTTLEEAKELRRIYDKGFQLILVTDALHMSRAMKLFTMEGFAPIPAPTNYKVKTSQESNSMKWWPSLDNINMMNYIVHELLGEIKASLFK